MKNLLQDVDSSNIDRIGYFEKAKVLFVQFLNSERRDGSNEIYCYYPFSKASFKKFTKAESKGKWFYEHVKDNPKLTVAKVG